VFDLRFLRQLLVITVGLLGFTGPLLADSRATLLDPTRPRGWQASDSTEAATEQQPQALKLQGTFSLAGKRSAVISGRRVVVGDQVAGARVLDIDKNKVILQLDGETVELAFTVPGVKSPANNRGDRR